MYAIGLKKLGQEWSMRPSEGMLCGVMQGFPVTMSEGAGYKQLVVNLCALRPDAPDAEPDLSALLAKPAKDYLITDYKVEGPYLTVRFFDNPGTMKKIREYVSVELPRLSQAGFVGAQACSHCEEPFQEEEGVSYTFDHYPLLLHARCVDDLKSDLESAEKEKAEEPERSSPLAPVGALLGGLIGCVPWILLYVIGYVASIAATLIALGANYGHRLFGGKAGKGRLVLVIVLTLLLTPVANALGVVAQFGYGIHTGELQEAWDISKESLTVADTLPILYEILKDPEASPEVLGSFARELITAYLFAALGLWAVWKKLRTENGLGRKALTRVP